MAKLKVLTISAGILFLTVLLLTSCGISLRSSSHDGNEQNQISPSEQQKSDQTEISSKTHENVPFEFNAEPKKHDPLTTHGGKKMHNQSKPCSPGKTSEPIKSPLSDAFTELNRAPRDGADEWIKLYNDTYGADSASKVIMTRSEISSMNRKMTNECHSMHDMSSMQKTISGDELRHMIRKYDMPPFDCYTSDYAFIDDAIRVKILENRNIDKTADAVELRRAVIVKRCSLKGFPTDIGFYKHKDLGHFYYDNIQETELIVGFPIAVAAESHDGQFLFVISYFYSGWIPIDAAAYCSDEDYNKFADPELYVTITEKKADCGNNASLLDMGVVLPYVSEDFDSYNVLLPVRLEDGSLDLKNEKIAKSDAVFGSLEFTQANFYNQAFAFLGSDYDWGGARGSVDCSGFTCAVFRSFGLYLPRNAGQQREFAGNVTHFDGGISITASLDSAKYPTAVYRPGHVMLYLGKKDGEYYIIHAPQGGEKVTTATLQLWNLTGISSFSFE